MERINIPIGNDTPTVDTPEYREEMLNKALGNQQEEDDSNEEQPQQDRLYADRYKTVEELEKSYKELQAAYTKSQQQKQTQQKPQIDNNNNTQEALKEIGLDFDNFNKEFQENGQLSDASYKQFEDKGIPRSFVDSYIEGQKAVVERINNTLYGVVGGQENFSKISEWAMVNMAKEEIDIINAELRSMDITRSKLAMEALNAKFERAKGSPPANLLTGSVSDSSGSVFRSWAEVKVAQSDPRYSKDPAYRKDITEKISRSVGKYL